MVERTFYVPSTLCCYSFTCRTIIRKADEELLLFDRWRLVNIPSITGSLPFTGRGPSPACAATTWHSPREGTRRIWLASYSTEPRSYVRLNTCKPSMPSFENVSSGMVIPIGLSTSTRREGILTSRQRSKRRSYSSAFRTMVLQVKLKQGSVLGTSKVRSVIFESSHS